METTEQLIMMGEAARQLGISRQRLRIMAEEGRLGKQYAGRYWFFTPEELERYKPLVNGPGGRGKRMDKESARLT